MTRLRSVLLPLLLAASVARAAASRCPVDQDRWDASNKALTAAVVFQGRLLAKSVDAAGNLLARFRVQKVLKPGALPLRRRQEVVVALVKSRPPRDPSAHVNRSAAAARRARTQGSGLGPRRRTLCPVSVPQGFVFNARYLVYANPVAGRAARRLLLPAAANFSAAATPDHYTRRAGRAVKKVVCEGCVLKPAQAKWLRSTSRADAYRRLQLRCKLNGNPIPWVQWYFMGKPIASNARVHIITKWRRSRLEIKSARRQDSGLYECRAWNVLRKEPSVVAVNVTVRDRIPPPPTPPEPTRSTASTTTNDSTLWPLKGRPCPLVSYCLNGGTCIFYEAVKEPVCQCAEGFIGQRCENKDTASLKTAPPEFDTTIQMMQSYWIR
ncbi:protein vein isoform X1 [Ixodes scapularis]|uniref:protein vein isoform X1 n=1 Tax=Ixodes scapularis TaxID=6945 RepID=UPI001A9EEA25|nr:protein vein isoform X1 [Ixodes scapularis]